MNFRAGAGWGRRNNRRGLAWATQLFPFGEPRQQAASSQAIAVGGSDRLGAFGR